MSYNDNLPPSLGTRLPSRVPDGSRLAPYTDAYPAQYGEAEEFHLRNLWRIARKHRWIIIGVTFVVTTLIAVDVFRAKNLYEATATIEIGRDNRAVQIGSNGLFVQGED